MIDFHPAMFESPAEVAPVAPVASVAGNAGTGAGTAPRAARSSYAPPPSATRSWFAFDRWTTVAATEDEFVLA